MKTITFSLCCIFALGSILIYPSYQILLAQQMSSSGTIKTGIWKNDSIKYVDRELAVFLKGGVSHLDAAASLSSYPVRIRRDFDSTGFGEITILDNTDALSFIDVLAGDPYIETAIPIQVGEIDCDATHPSDPYFQNGTQWALSKIYICEAWDISQGSSSMIISILDTGIPLSNATTLSHPDLDAASRYIIGPDYVFGREGMADNHNYSKDENGHGTHVTGIAAAESDNGIGIAGVDRQCRVLCIQAADSFGLIRNDSFYDAVRYAVDNGARVINYSASFGRQEPLLENAVIYAESHDVVLVSTSGSRGFPTIWWPAAFSATHCNVIAVGATDHTDTKAQYSHYGPALDIMAPGGYGEVPNADDIASTWPTYPVNGTPGPISSGYAYYYGTSMAAPMVTGVASLLRSYYPAKTASDIRDLIRYTADKVSGMNGSYRTNEYGYGRLNAYSALSTLPNSPIPYAPANVAASNCYYTPHQHYHACLSWQANTSNESNGIYVKGYKIYRKINNGSWSVRATVCQSTTSWQDGETVVAYPKNGSVYHIYDVNQYFRPGIGSVEHSFTHFWLSSPV